MTAGLLQVKPVSIPLAVEILELLEPTRRTERHFLTASAGSYSGYEVLENEEAEKSWKMACNNNSSPQKLKTWLKLLSNSSLPTQNLS